MCCLCIQFTHENTSERTILHQVSKKIRGGGQTPPDPLPGLVACTAKKASYAPVNSQWTELFILCVYMHALRPVYTQLQEHSYIYTNTQLLTHPCVTPPPLLIYMHKNEVRYCNRKTNIILINWFECNQQQIQSSDCK